MSDRKAHLLDGELSAYLLGNLPDAEQQAVEVHLDECRECEERAAEATPRDALVELLSSAAIGSLADAPFSVFGNTVSSRFDATPGDCPSTIGFDGFLATANPTPPTVLTGHSRYRVVRLLGYGGMGNVWLAEHLVMGRPVALKVIRPELLVKAGTLERFQREMQVAAKLNHPNIAHAYDAEQIGDSHFLVMEYVAGQTLFERVKAGPLPITAACQAVRDAALGLAHAHAAGLVHRDVKPGNLIQTDEGTVKVLDFGLAISAEADSSLTAENLVMGTPDYVAPEQAEDPHAADARSDIYSLGCSLYHLLAGRVPFADDSMVKKIDAHRFRDPELIADVPKSLWLIVAKMMAKQPAQRFQTALEVAEALEPFCESEGNQSRSHVRQNVGDLADTPRSGERGYGSATSRSHRRRTATLVASLAVLLGVVIYRIQTDKGELVITADEDAEISIKQGGKEVRIYDTKSKQKLILNSGTYDLELKGKPTGLKLDIEKATLMRGGQVFAHIQQITANPPAAAKPIGQSALDVLPTMPRPKLLSGPQPLDELRREAISEVELANAGGGDPLQAPQELVGLIGDSRLRHGAAVTGLLWHPDGERLYAWGASGDLVCWDARKGRVRWRHDSAEHLPEVPNSAFGAFGCLSADAKWLIVPSVQGWIQFLDAETGKPGKRFTGLTPALEAVAISHDGKWLAASGTDYTVRVWDIKAEKQVWIAKGTYALRLHFSEDGAALCAIGFLDNMVSTWETGTGKVVQRVKLETTEPEETWAISGDGRTIGSTSSGRGSEARVWDADTGRLKWTIAAERSRCTRITLSHDGQLAATGGVSPHPVSVWEVESRKRLFQTSSAGFVYKLAFSSDKRLLAVGDSIGKLRLFEVPGGRELLSEGRLIRSLDVSPNGRQVIGSEIEFRSNSPDWHSLGMAWDVPTLRPQEMSRSDPAAMITFYQTVFSPDGAAFATAANDRRMTIWDAKTHQSLAVGGTPNDVLGVCWRPDGKQLATAGNDGAVRLWSTRGAMLKALTGHAGAVGSVAYHRDGRYVASAGQDGTIRLWDALTDELIHSLPGLASNWNYQQAAFSPDGKRLVAIHGKQVQRWSLVLDDRGRLTDVKSLPALDGHERSLVRLAFHPTTNLLATRSLDGTIRLWDAAGRESRTIRVPSAPTAPYQENLAFSPDGRHLLLRHQNGVVYILRLEVTD